jgi:endonuclease/exonuclease/phosphatase family metal-dependent hydrolase
MKKKAFVFLVLGLSFFNGVFTQTTVKMMSYNLLNFTTSSQDRIPYFKTVVTNSNPDILVVQEMTSQAAVNLFYSQVLSPAYSAGVFIDGPDSDNAIFYKNALFSFIGNMPITTALRNISQFTIVHNTTGDTLRIYSVHLKASTGGSNEAQRAAEVAILRNVTNSLGTGKNFIVCGDFNIYKSTEQAYINLKADNGNNEGYFIDPFQMTGSWNSVAYAQYHTQSPRIRQFGGGATGGMDDRFDLLLYSQAIADPGGMAYVSNSTWAVGNDGNHYNDSVNAQPNTSVSIAVANALHNASDHLPVVAQFTFEQEPLVSHFEVDLTEGWNGISSYLLPENVNVEAMLAGLGIDFIVLKNLNQTYWPEQNINTIINWDYKSGYMIKVENATSLAFDGFLPESKTIQIVTGWNLIPVIADTPQDIITLFGSNTGNIEIIKDVAGNQVFWPDQGINTLGNLMPQKSYFLKSTQAFTISY